MPTPGSPWVCIIRVKPVGDKASGIETVFPRIVVDGSREATSLSTRGPSRLDRRCLVTASAWIHRSTLCSADSRVSVVMWPVWSLPVG